MAGWGEGDFPEILSGTDVGHLTAEKRSELSTLLDECGVSHRIVGSELQADAAEVELVEHLVEYLAQPPERRLGPPPIPDRVVPPSETRLGSEPSPRWRRLVAFLVEGYVLAAAALAVGAVMPNPGRAIAVVALWVTSGLVLVATTGRTIGMWMFNMRIVAQPAAKSLGWRTASVRFVVLYGPGLLALALQPLVSAALTRSLGFSTRLWFLVCVAPILFDPYRRGIHDRVAGTVVVGADSFEPLG